MTINVFITDVDNALHQLCRDRSNVDSVFEDLLHLLTASGYASEIEQRQRCSTIIYHVMAKCIHDPKMCELSVKLCESLSLAHVQKLSIVKDALKDVLCSSPFTKIHKSISLGDNMEECVMQCGVGEVCEGVVRFASHIISQQIGEVADRDLLIWRTIYYISAIYCSSGTSPTTKVQEERAGPGSDASTFDVALRCWYHLITIAGEVWLDMTPSVLHLKVGSAVVDCVCHKFITPEQLDLFKSIDTCLLHHLIQGSGHDNLQQALKLLETASPVPSGPTLPKPSPSDPLPPSPTPTITLLASRAAVWRQQDQESDSAGGSDQESDNDGASSSDQESDSASNSDQESSSNQESDKEQESASDEESGSASDSNQESDSDSSNLLVSELVEEGDLVRRWRDFQERLNVWLRQREDDRQPPSM